MHHERIAILDYGSQYTRLITRRLRDLGAFGLVYGPTATAAEIAGADLTGIILSGGPKSVMEAGAPPWTRPSWNWACPSSASATASSCWPGTSAA